MRQHRLLALVSCLVLASCGGGDSDSSSAPSSVELGQEYLVGFGETIRFDSLSLEFTTLAEESRCPSTANCVWEGNARILITASRGSKTSVLELNTSRRFQTSAVFETHLIELRKLEPYPVIPAFVPSPQNYTATLFVDGLAVPGI